jgi:hypothetical protein
MRVDSAIHPIARGTPPRANGASLSPAVQTIARESHVAINIPFRTWVRNIL